LAAEECSVACFMHFCQLKIECLVRMTMRTISTRTTVRKNEDKNYDDEEEDSENEHDVDAKCL